MNFYPNQIFHVYNQGNNRQTIFYTDSNYEYFLWKMKAYILPFADIIAYCLMPNHFHWLIYVRKIAVERKFHRLHVESIELQRRKLIYGESAIEKIAINKLRTNEDALISLNESVGILQRSYTRALNVEKGWSGSLFRSDCKSKDGWIDEFITVEKFKGVADHRFSNGNNYAFSCFHYIHENPVKARLVNESVQWPYSSAMEYAGLTENSICNLELGRSFV